MLNIDWRSAAAYRHTKSIAAAGFAWEYLRRDADYHRDYRAISRDRIRYLLADEVGLGKTIEAGLVLRELKLRGRVNGFW